MIKLLICLTICTYVFARPTLIKPEAKNIAIITDSNFLGETNFAYRLKSACQNMGWKAEIIDVKTSNNLKKAKYDFAINLGPFVYQRPKCKNYLAVFHPTKGLFKKSGYLMRKYTHYDGYLLTFSPSVPDKNFGSSKRPYMMWYPSVQRVEYKKVNPTHLFHLCSTWGDRFKDEKYLECFHLLDGQPFMRFYGNPIFKERYPQSFQSSIPFDENSLFEIAANEGITLVLHSVQHNAHGIPSGRIFEAAASSTVIISDTHPFVKEHFGDNVLYIDTQNDGQAIFDQIVTHMHWIAAHPSQAQEMAKKTYEIQDEKFSLEKQLIELGIFHEERSKLRFIPWVNKIFSGIISSFKK